MTEYVYRVVDQNDKPLGGGSPTGRQHVYVKRGTAKGVASQQTAQWWNGERTYRVQRAAVEWEDVPE